jgi:uncharacterized Fe-S center protein
MPSTVYWHKIDNGTDVRTIQRISRQLLATLVERENVTLAERIPLKVHFGEAGNVTYVKPENYDGVIDLLEERGVEPVFMETSVLYGGKRYRSDVHEQTAREHGFTRLPIVFADGEAGEHFTEVEIDKKHFRTFKVGGAFGEYDQVLILAHFKGHMMAGFGGAIKQLGMGCAAKGGKLAMHSGVKPQISNRKCKRCKVCQTRCNADALIIEESRSYIDHDKCVGCGACMAICPHKAISVMTARGVLSMLGGMGNSFGERLAEGAYAAQLGKRNIYMNFAMSITRGCDCEGRKMRPVMDDFGIFASTDPVAIDKVCCDMAAQRGRKFRGQRTIAYAERIGMGSQDYVLQEI